MTNGTKLKSRPHPPPKKVLMFICLFSKQSNICFFVLEVPLEPLEFPFSFCSASKSLWALLDHFGTLTKILHAARRWYYCTCYVGRKQKKKSRNVRLELWRPLTMSQIKTDWLENCLSKLVYQRSQECSPNVPYPPLVPNDTSKLISDLKNKLHCDWSWSIHTYMLVMLGPSAYFYWSILEEGGNWTLKTGIGNLTNVINLFGSFGDKLPCFPRDKMIFPDLSSPGIQLEEGLGAIYETFLGYDVNSSLHGNIWNVMWKACFKGFSEDWGQSINLHRITLSR